MKKYVVMSLIMLISSLTFAQKKEVNAIDKAIKKGDFNTAKSALQVAEGLLSAMDDKTKAKFYFLKGQTLYANGAGSDSDISEAVNSFNTSSEIENNTGKRVYTQEINALKENIVTNFAQKGQEALKNKSFSKASTLFESAYRLSQQDTLYLYNSALLAQNAQDYDRTLKIYEELTELGYTGIYIEYYATNIESNEEESFPSEQLRDISIRAKTHNNPRNEKQPSKVSDIAKNTALIYVNQGKNAEAIAAIDKAKSLNPGDYNLLVSEASIRYQLGEIEKYRELIKEAVKLQPNNVDLIYNLGITAAELNDYKAAQEYYDKALEIDPKYVSALVASSILIINQEQAIIDEMNSLGTSAADDKKFEELKAKRNQLYLDAIPYLEKALDIKPNDLDAAKTLMNLYSAIDDQEKFQAMKAKVAELEGN